MKIKKTISFLTFLAVLFINISLWGAISLTTARLDGTLRAIEQHYLEPARIDPRKMLKNSIENLQKSVPEVMVSYKGSDTLTLTVGHATRKFSYAQVNDLPSLKKFLHDVWAFIAANYTGDEKAEDIETVLLNGILDSLDPHSGFLSKKIYDEFMIGTRGKFGGIGIVISVRDGMLTVIAPIEGTPAYNAGVKAGDRIVQIDDESTINMSLTDAVNKLRGDPNTSVVITVEREGKPSRKLGLTRAIINIDSVKHATLMEGDKKIGYIGIRSFQSNTYKDVVDALKNIKSGRELDGLILDMRNNPGGLLSSAVKISDLFLNDGVILSTVGRGNVEMEKDMANVSGTEPPYPVLILINEGSASASEIIAGALQYNDRAIVAGSESFGKGSVQTIIETGGGTALKMTIARYLPAGEFSVQLEGVAPDIEILPAVVDKEQINLFRDKTLSEADLEKHLEKDTNSKNLPKPKYLLRYLKPKSGDEDLDEISRREYSKKPSFEDDFPVQFATKFLTLAGKSSRNEMLKTGKGTIDGMNAEENAKIKKALASLGVDWSEAPKTHAKPGLHLGSSIYSGEKIISRARAGDKIELKLVATNSGKGDFSQLVAIGQSEDNAFLSDREFPFGLLKADQTRKWSIPIELPEHLPTQDLVMAVEFREENGNAPEKTEVVIPVQGLEQPVFSFSYSVPTKNLSKNFESGQSIPFDVEITNLGKGKSSEDTSAAITDKCDDKIFIENGRVKLGVMKPGDKKKEKFRFHTLAGYDPSKCKMVLSIVDAKLATGLSKELDVNPSTGTISPQPGTVLYPPSIEIGEYPLTTKKKIERITGNIESKNGIFDYYVFVGNNKIAYETNPKGLNKLPLALDIELKEGSNKIIIVARNPEKIARSKTIVIHRTKSK